MEDQLEQSLREALSDRAAQVKPDSIARLQAIDYRPRRRQARTIPTIGALGTTGIAATVAAIVALGSGTAPAFAGWTPTPNSAISPPAQAGPGAQGSCGKGLGSAVLTDSRGPYTASIYANSTTSAVCLSGNGVSVSNTDASTTPVSVAAGQIQFSGGGTRDSAGNALTLLDGHIGTGVTGVTIDLSDGSSVQATVTDGLYLAWWPGTVKATDAKITTASGTSTVAVPTTPTLSTPNCPSGAHCGSGYAFGSAPGNASSNGAAPGNGTYGASSSDQRTLTVQRSGRSTH